MARIISFRGPIATNMLPGTLSKFEDPAFQPLDPPTHFGNHIRGIWDADAVSANNSGARASFCVYRPKSLTDNRPGAPSSLGSSTSRQVLNPDKSGPIQWSTPDSSWSMNNLFPIVDNLAFTWASDWHTASGGTFSTETDPDTCYTPTKFGFNLRKDGGITDVWVVRWGTYGAQTLGDSVTANTEPLIVINRFGVPNVDTHRAEFARTVYEACTITLANPDGCPTLEANLSGSTSSTGGAAIDGFGVGSIDDSLGDNSRRLYVVNSSISPTSTITKLHGLRNYGKVPTISRDSVTVPNPESVFQSLVTDFICPDGNIMLVGVTDFSKIPGNTRHGGIWQIRNNSNEGLGINATGAEASLAVGINSSESGRGMHGELVTRNFGPLGLSGLADGGNRYDTSQHTNIYGRNLTGGPWSGRTIHCTIFDAVLGTIMVRINGTVVLLIPGGYANFIAMDNHQLIVNGQNLTTSDPYASSTLQIMRSENKFCELHLYNNNAVTMAEDVEGYLAWKWDIFDKLPADHTHKTKPPVA